MLTWAISFLIIALIASIFGFSNMAVGAQSISRIMFFISLIFFLGVLLFGEWLGMDI